MKPRLSLISPAPLSPDVRDPPVGLTTRARSGTSGGALSLYAFDVTPQDFCLIQIYSEIDPNFDQPPFLNHKSNGYDSFCIVFVTESSSSTPKGGFFLAA